MVPMPQDLYPILFNALGVTLRQDRASSQRELLTRLPLAFKRRGDFQFARTLFQQAAQADPRHAPVYQAWAPMEKERGDPARALEILEQGLQRVREARDRALLLSAKGSLLARQGRFPEAEQAFKEALALDERNPLTHYHYARDCLLPQGRREAACEHLRRAQALRPRKRRDRERIARALQQYGCTP